MKIILKLLYISGKYRFWIILAALIGFITIGSSIGLIMTSAYIIAKAALHPSIFELQVAIVGVRFFGISRGVFRYLERVISHNITFHLLEKFRIWFFKLLAPLYPSKFKNLRSSDILNKSIAQIENLEIFYVKIVGPILISVFVFLTFFFFFGMFSFYYSFIISLFYLLGVIILPIATYQLSKKYNAEILKYQEKLTHQSIDLVAGISELIVFGAEEKFLKRFNKTNHHYILLQRKHAIITALNDSIVLLLMNLAVISVLYFAITEVTNGMLEGVFLSVLTLGTMSIFEAVFPIPQAFSELKKTTQSAKGILELDKIGKSSKTLNQKININDFSININSLNFSYTNTEIIRDFSVSFSQNSFTAIVGKSGSGKSTLANILLKFWEHRKGKIFIGGRDLHSFSQEEIVKHISVLSQQTQLFNLSLQENIKFSKPNATLDEVISAARKANIHNFINSLPNKYDELIGEQGLKLSGGERKRIALARIFLKNTPIMIFDEAASDLDSINEEIILQNILSMKDRKTIIYITHKVTNLKNADNILVMKNGKLIEEGTFNHLMDTNGYFKKMYNIQTNLL
ncbi:MAG: thiol reductant ABC exporter subunit CydC [Ignavibacteriae bacterium]|nr:MAG: thiol reductant ABC exporter subunit CydC [Ignavibacteriota bacterium]